MILYIKQYKIDNLKLMLNRLISLVILFFFLNIYPVYSETNFLLPQKKPSIFKKTEKEIQQTINKNLPVPKPTLQKIEPIKITKNEKETDKVKKDKKVELQKEKKNEKTIKSVFVYPKKKPITYKVSSKEVETSKVLNKKDFARAKETIKFIK